MCFLFEGDGIFYVAGVFFVLLSLGCACFGGGMVFFYVAGEFLCC